LEAHATHDGLRQDDRVAAIIRELDRLALPAVAADLGERHGVGLGEEVVNDAVAAERRGIRDAGQIGDDDVSGGRARRGRRESDARLAVVAWMERRPHAAAAEAELLVVGGDGDDPIVAVATFDDVPRW
jgi:hypothetical protein